MDYHHTIKRKVLKKVETRIAILVSSRLQEAQPARVYKRKVVKCHTGVEAADSAVEEQDKV